MTKERAKRVVECIITLVRDLGSGPSQATVESDAKDLIEALSTRNDQLIRNQMIGWINDCLGDQVYLNPRRQQTSDKDDQVRMEMSEELFRMAKEIVIRVQKGEW